jgi:hypothetical protein
MHTTSLHVVLRQRVHGGVPTSFPCAYVDCCQEQRHQCTIYNHKFQVVEFGKNAGGCEFLGLLAVELKSPPFWGFWRNSRLLSALYYSATYSVISFGNIAFDLRPLIQAHD